MLQHSQSSRVKKEPTDTYCIAYACAWLSSGLGKKRQIFNSTLNKDYDKSINTHHTVRRILKAVILNLIINAFTVSEKKGTPASRPEMAESSKRC
jgi:hypothetical protein